MNEYSTRIRRHTKPSIPYAVQLYTVRDYMEKDVAGTLPKIRVAGYRNVELAGTYGLEDAAFAQLLQRNGLRAISMHTGYELVTQDPAAVIRSAGIFGVKFAVVGGIDQSLTPNRAGWEACGAALDAAGRTLREAGIHLCYHNHAHEFKKIRNDYPHDILFGAASPENLKAQLDTFWIEYAGLKPANVIAKFEGRCPLLHVKDMVDKHSRAFAEVGQGILDWPAIFEAGAAAGVEWYIVEQDACARDSLACIQTSAEFLVRQ